MRVLESIFQRLKQSGLADELTPEERDAAQKRRAEQLPNPDDDARLQRDLHRKQSVAGQQKPKARRLRDIVGKKKK